MFVCLFETLVYLIILYLFFHPNAQDIIGCNQLASLGWPRNWALVKHPVTQWASPCILLLHLHV